VSQTFNINILRYLAQGPVKINSDIAWGRPLRSINAELHIRAAKKHTPPKQTYHQETSRRVGVDGEFLAEENCTFSGWHEPPRPGPPGVDPGSTYPLAIGFFPLTSHFSPPRLDPKRSRRRVYTPAGTRGRNFTHLREAVSLSVQYLHLPL
jgi:hypothetical protein